MKLELKYTGASAIVNEVGKAKVAFATNQLRDPTFFNGVLGRPLVFREAEFFAPLIGDFRPATRGEHRGGDGCQEGEKQDKSRRGHVGRHECSGPFTLGNENWVPCLGRDAR